MIEPKAQTRLQELFRRENRSFLQYVNEASPWAGDGDKPVLDKLHRLAAEELEALGVFAAWLDSAHIPLPYLRAFPTTFTNYNFIAVRKLIKPLLVEQRRELAALEADAATLTDVAAKQQVETIIKLNKQHLDEILQLQG